MTALSKLSNNTTVTLAWRNLWRYKRRTWLTVGAMVFSNVLLVFMVTLQFGTYGMMIENSLKAFSSHIQISHTGYHHDNKMRQILPNIQSTVNTLRKQFPEAAFTARASTFVLAASEERSFGLQIVGVEPAFEPAISTIPGLMTHGHYLTQSLNHAPIAETDEIPIQARTPIILGAQLAKNLKVNIGEELTLMGSGLDGSFAAGIAVVAGIFSSGIADIDRTVAQISLTDFNTLFTMEKAGHNIMVNAPNIADTPLLTSRINPFLSSHKNIEILTWEQRHPEIKQAIQSDMVSSWVMFAVLALLVSFSVLNTQLMSVLERTREFGIMLAIGFKPSRLARLIALETTLMALIGFAIGLLLGGALAFYLSIAGFSYPGMEESAATFNLPSKIYPSLSPAALMLGPGIIFMGCMLAAIYPSLRVFFLQPVSAMRTA